MANTKYSPEDAAKLVASDEPTFILRAKDSLSVKVLQFYKRLLIEHSEGDYEKAASVRDCEKRFTNWQVKNLDKVQHPTP